MLTLGLIIDQANVIKIQGEAGKGVKICLYIYIIFCLMRNSKDYLAPLKVAKWSFKDSRDSEVSQLAHIYFHSMGEPTRMPPISNSSFWNSFSITLSWNKKGLCLMKWPSETLQILPWFWNTKTQVVFYVFHFMLLYFP